LADIGFDRPVHPAVPFSWASYSYGVNLCHHQQMQRIVCIRHVLVPIQDTSAGMCALLEVAHCFFLPFKTRNPNENGRGTFGAAGTFSERLIKALRNTIEPGQFTLPTIFRSRCSSGVECPCWRSKVSSVQEPSQPMKISRFPASRRGEIKSLLFPCPQLDSCRPRP
jgi:hypothetical protein